MLSHPTAESRPPRDTFTFWSFGDQSDPGPRYISDSSRRAELKGRGGKQLMREIWPGAMDPNLFHSLVNNGDGLAISYAELSAESRLEGLDPTVARSQHDIVLNGDMMIEGTGHPRLHPLETRVDR